MKKILAMFFTLLFVIAGVIFMSCFSNNNTNTYDDYEDDEY